MPELAKRWNKNQRLLTSSPTIVCWNRNERLLTSSPTIVCWNKNERLLTSSPTIVGPWRGRGGEKRGIRGADASLVRPVSGLDGLSGGSDRSWPSPTPGSGRRWLDKRRD